MLVEPAFDPQRAQSDRALVCALTARLALKPDPAGGTPTPDGNSLALRSVLEGVSGDDIDTARQTAILKAVWGRLDQASQLHPLITVGPDSLRLGADRFGLTTQVSPEALGALDQVARGYRALIDLGTTAWWGRLLARPDIRIQSALPDNEYGLPQALLIGRGATGPTGRDRTLWVTDTRLGVDHVVTRLAATGLVARPLIAAGGLKLMMLTGYVQAQDGRLDQAPGDLKGVIGWAPVF